MSTGFGSTACYPLNPDCLPGHCCPPSPSPCPPEPCPPEPCPPEPCPSYCATPPIKPTKRLIKYCPCCPPEPLCCRPKWVNHDFCVCKPTPDYRVSFNFCYLPAPSCRYQKWIASVGSQVDSNICASLYSSKCAHQAGIRAMPPPYCQPPCPCHCCCPNNTDCCEWSQSPVRWIWRTFNKTAISLWI